MTFSTAKSLTLSEFEQFAVHSNVQEEAIIGRPLLGSRRFKAISSLSIQRYSGETASIVQDFKKALSQKYGEELAGFVFSQKCEQAALSQGLAKKTITAVLKKASILEGANFLNYRQALKTKHDVAIAVVKKLRGTSCYEEAKKKYKAIQKQLQEFDNALTNFESDLKFDEQRQKKLQYYFQEKLSGVDLLARHIASLLDAEEKIKKIFGSAGRSKEMLKVFLQHQEVMEELKNEFHGTWRPSTCEAAMKGVANSLDPLVRVIEKAATLLSSFSIHFKELPLSSCFSLNQRGEVIVQEQTEKDDSAQRAQEHAACVFFDALKKCYGADFINALRTEENQNHSLTVGEAMELFKKIHGSFERLATFFQKQPLLITKEYLDALLAHPHLARQAEHDDQQLEPPEKSLLQSMRGIINTSIIGVGHYAASSSYSLIAGSHASHLAVLGAASGALGIAAVIGAVIGWTALRYRHEQVQMEAAGISAIFTMESTLSEIATTLIFPDGGTTWNFIRDTATSGLISGGIGLGVDAPAIVNAARNAFVGGGVSGALTAGAEVQHAPVSANSTQSLHAEEPHEQINVEDEVNLDARLGIKYAWSIAVSNLSKLMKAVAFIPEANDRIPVKTASVEVMRSRRTKINL